MAEIKSTMDIIMEKTRNMTMSEDEKDEFRKQEIRGKVKGLIVRFLDGFVKEEVFKEEMASLKRENPEIAKEAVIEEISSRIRLGDDNQEILALSEMLDLVDVESLKGFLKDFEQDLEKKKAMYQEMIMHNLRHKGISGSAVIPNVEANPEWLEYRSEKSREFREKFIELKVQS